MTTTTRRSVAQLSTTFVFIAGLTFSCGGSVGGNSGGESHFLSYCDAICADGLDCISGLCTRSCLVDNADCSDLHPGAKCTDQSIEPGAVAVCDLGCTLDGDCAKLGAGFSCEQGYCRESGGLTTGGSGGGGTGNGPSCELLFQEYPDQSVVDNPTGCGECTCNAGEWNCQNATCAVGTPVFACPPQVQSDPIEVTSAFIQGDALLLDVGYGGGCERHDVGLCYEESFLESYPVQGKLHLIHDGHGDACAAYATNTLTFDLRPYADFYLDAYQAQGGIIASNYGTYAFGDLSCEDRTLAAGTQVREAAEQTLTFGCSSADDCVWASSSTSCSIGCGAMTSKLAGDRYETTRQQVEATACGDFEGDGCVPIPIPPCVAPLQLDCVDGECVVAQ